MKKGNYNIGLIVILLGILFMMGSSNLPATKKEKLKHNRGPGFVIMELFTSQGCSSCPAADEILGMYALQNEEYIFPLAFHVDYWNRLGWIDTFSNKAFSQRQRDYAQQLNLESVYTPQLVINGQKQLVGSDIGKIATIVSEYLKKETAVQISITGIQVTDNKVQVEYQVSNLFSNTEVNAVLVQKNSSTQIKAGENRGRVLTNYNIVRDFKTKKITGATGHFTLALPAGNSRENYMVVLFVQENTTRHIMSATRMNCK